MEKERTATSYRPVYTALTPPSKAQVKATYMRDGKKKNRVLALHTATHGF